MTNQHLQFASLISRVRSCVKCDRMCNSARVLNYSAGNLNADLFFVGEAPGRLGADETEVPFHGDVSGKNFEDLLRFAEIKRDDIFVTNAVLCNPKDHDGNNATPTLAEVANCLPHLREQIELVDPKIVISVGNTALRALAGIEPHGLTLNANVRTINRWFGRFLIPVYHPGQRAMVHRSFPNQRSDYQFIAEEWHRLPRGRRRSNSITRGDVLSLARYLLGNRGRLTYFELHKLAYLTEYLHVRRTGRRLTSAYFIRQKDGPYCTDLEVNRLRRADNSIRVFTDHGALWLTLQQGTYSHLFPEQIELSSEARTAADEAIQRYADKSGPELKTAVYLTAPMRFLLRREKSTGTNLYNAPIDFLAAK